MRTQKLKDFRDRLWVEFTLKPFTFSASLFVFRVGSGCDGSNGGNGG